MKVSLSWLKEYVSVEMGISALTDALTMAGLEVDSVFDRYEFLERILVGRVIKVESHPNADRLKVCQVDVGERLVEVVCGAPNVTEGMLSPCALPGTCFPNGVILKEGTIRGKTSYGMLCSEAELGIGEGKAGIMALNPDTVIGMPLNEALDLSDVVIEIDLTPNRPDCLSHIGVAREIAVFHQTKVNYPQIELPSGIDDITDYTSVTIEDPDLCPRYAAQVLFDIKVAPSPCWLQDRLISVGLKPINNIVDITNYVMMETGQPLHAFDYDRLFENRIVVRRAKQDEIFTTLDEKERKLTSEMLMICDGEKPVALAGVMGGLNSEIEASTTKVLIESACFDPGCVRKTSKKLGLNTDASHRFERGVDPDGTITALNRAAQLMVDIAEGKLIKGAIDNHSGSFRPKPISLSVPYTNRLIGMDVDLETIKHHFESIEFKVDESDSDTLEVLPPTFRVDVIRPEDLIEEVARLIGYNNIQTTFPKIPAEIRKPSGGLVLRNRIKDSMTGFGFKETVNYSFISKLSCDRLRLDDDDFRRNVVEILNPITEDQTVMRTSLVPGILETAHRNISKQERNIKIYEIGKVFFNKGKDKQPTEVMMMAGLWTGERTEPSWHFKESECDFYDIKGVVECLFSSLKYNDAFFTKMPKESCFYTRSGHTARILAGEEDIGLVGEVDSQVLGNFDLKQTAFLFELNLEHLLPLIPESVSAKLLPKFPPVSRDATLIIDKAVEAREVLASIQSSDEELIEALHLFDVYDGDPIPKGKKSISFRIVYRSQEKTLEDEFVNTIHTSVMDNIIKQYNALLPT